jgi:hypothetical protein
MGEFDHKHSAFDRLLKRYVMNGRVDYEGFASSKEEFNEYLAALAEADTSGWSREEKLAFWINAYNAFTIKAIIDNFPVSSIKEIPGVWDRLTFKAGGMSVTLGQIEHKILRKDVSEPLIHFAIVCASLGCPKLRSESFKAETIMSQLRDSASDFVNDEDKVSIRPDRSEVRVSRIFKWFGEDFVGRFGDPSSSSWWSNGKDKAVLNFLSVYIKSEPLREFLKNGQAKIKYLPYDWHLNTME